MFLTDNKRLLNKDELAPESIEFLREQIAGETLKKAAPQLLKALERAKQFIENGVEFGYIRMPDLDTPDAAHNTLPMINAAIAAAKGGVMNVTERFREALTLSAVSGAENNLAERYWCFQSLGFNYLDSHFLAMGEFAKIKWWRYGC